MPTLVDSVSRNDGHEFADNGKVRGFDTRVLRAQLEHMPFVEIECIDLNGNVILQQTGTNERNWRRHLEAQGRFVVAELGGVDSVDGAREEYDYERSQKPQAKRGMGMGICHPESELARLRAKNGYKIVRDPTGRRGPVVELLPGPSEIRKRRDDHRTEMEEARRNKPADRVTIAEAMARMNPAGGVSAPPTDVNAMLVAMQVRMDKLEAENRQLRGEPPPAPPSLEAFEDDAGELDEMPAPEVPPEAPKGKKGRG